MIGLKEISGSLLTARRKRFGKADLMYPLSIKAVTLLRVHHERSVLVLSASRGLPKYTAKSLSLD